MRVLITNNTLDTRAGSEMYVRDVAVALLRRGHNPVAYSTNLGPVARELRNATVPVVDDLSRLTVAPDVIHGQHHLDAMTAMLRFPQTPAVYFCHGWLPWEELPPKFPTLQHYVAVDNLCAERLQCERGVDREHIHLIRNFVDLHRFAQRDGLSAMPARALVYSNYAREGGYLDTIRHACAQRGISVDAIGSSLQRSKASPELVLGRYDIVFAKARSALEAMASGCATIVCDATGLAGLVTEENYAAWRKLNFGVRTMQRPISEDNILREIDSYDAERARLVAQRTRAEADMEPAIDAIVGVYEQAIADHHRAPADAATTLTAASDYLREIAEVAKQRHLAQHLCAIAQAETATIGLRIQQTEQANNELTKQLGDSSRQVASVTEQRDLADQLRTVAQAETTAISLRVREAEQANGELSKKLSDSLRQVAGVAAQRDLASESRAAAQAEIAAINLRVQRTEQANSELSKQLGDSLRQIANVAEQRDMAYQLRAVAQSETATTSLHIEQAEQANSALSKQIGDCLSQVEAAAEQRDLADKLRAIAQIETATMSSRVLQAEQANSELSKQLTEVRRGLMQQEQLVQCREASARRRLVAARRALAEQHEAIAAIEQHAATRATNVHGTLNTPFWQLLRRAYSARSTYANCMAARLRLLPSRNSTDELIENIQDGSLAEYFGESAKVVPAASVALSRELTSIFTRLNIRSLVEVSCGRCLWLKGGDAGLQQYTGIDIVPEIIEHNRHHYSGRGWKFELLDVAATAAIPHADAVLCRDWLEYLTNDEALSVVSRVRDSGARHFIAGSHDSIASNGESENGGWRPLNLMQAPFNLPMPDERILTDHSGNRALGVWRLVST